MYVCLCNALTNTRIEEAVADGARRPRDVYGACGCRAQCGTCTKAVLCLIREALAGTSAATASHAAAEG